MDSLDHSSLSTHIQHLNIHALETRFTSDKGRGVFATRVIPKGTLVEVSPVLLFSPNEWEEHGRHTVLDHYTFIWRIPGQVKPSMALALGLGSIFNHSSRPNVSYLRNIASHAIEYTASRNLEPGEELCISYGDESRLWFRSAEDTAPSSDDEGPWGGLEGILTDAELMSELGGDDLVSDEEDVWTTGNLEEIVPPELLPFERTKSIEELEEEETDEIKTMEAWVVDVEDTRMISGMLRFIKDQGLDTPDLNHLRRVRKADNKSSVLLSIAPPPALPASLPPPYLHAVPKLPAKDHTDLQRKNLLWPTEPALRSQEERKWTRGEVAWVSRGLKRAIDVAREAGLRGEMPVGSYVCNALGDQEIEAIGTDTRRSSNHPLRHSAFAAIRAISDIRLSGSSTAGPDLVSASPSAPDSPAASAPGSRTGTPAPSASTKNGADYLLTSLTLFTTHEPCIMCSMALVHSRVKDVFFIRSMEGTGGCGGAEGRGCGVVGKGVNHRFGVWHWTGGGLAIEDVGVGVDA